MSIEYLDKNTNTISCDISSLQIMKDDKIFNFIKNLNEKNINFIFKGSVSDLIQFENVLLKYGFENDNIETIKDGISYFEAKFCILKNY